MVLDLRNNGGGHVISSNMLSTCIAGAACQGKVYEYYRYNDSRMATVEKTARETGKEYDTAAKKFFDEFYYGDYYGVDLRNYALNMTRLYVLVTGNTASSSEAVINTLRGLDGFTVKLIGEKTQRQERRHGGQQIHRRQLQLRTGPDIVPGLQRQAGDRQQGRTGGRHRVRGMGR